MQQVADDDDNLKRHVGRHKVAKTKDVKTAQQPDEQNDDKTANAEKEAPKGALAKFFTWLKGKKPPATEDTDTTRTGLGMVPQD